MLNLQLLNPEQRKAVEKIDGALLILAGAGSGKTRVITHRIAHLILNKNVSPENILAVTFTNKASREMFERAAKLIKGNLKGLTVSTFHAFGVRFLKKYISKIGYESNFSICDETDQLAIIKQALKKITFDPKKFQPQIVLSKISRAKNSGQELEFWNEADDDYDVIMPEIFQFYQSRLKINNLVDFDDLILLPLKIFRENPDLIPQVSVRYKYIMVDEYQDTNGVQDELLKYLADYHKNICVVGDDDQSIYGWRGAESKNILEFDRVWENCETIKLEQNYRSTTTILNAANSLIKNNSARKDKNLWSALGEGDPIYYFDAPNDREEADFVANQIKLIKHSKHRDNRDFAVLFRRNTQSRPIEEQLRFHGISYKLIGGYTFYERNEIKDILAYLKLFVNPKDEMSLERIINIPTRGIGQVTYEKLSGYAHLLEITVVDAMHVVENIVDMQTEKRDKITNFYQLFIEFREKFSKNPISEVLLEFLNKINFSKHLAKVAKNDQDFQNRKDNVVEFINSMKDFEQRFSEPTLEKFIDRIMLLSQDTNDDQTNNAVTLMSLHASKGLEFPYVFMIGMEEGIFPSRRTLEESGDASEERRLCYVGITRAQQGLFLTAVKERRKYNETYTTEPSRFLKEIPRDLFDRPPFEEESEVARHEKAKVAAQAFFEQLKKLKER
jgi:superfamily I DNA/RNA helicase